MFLTIVIPLKDEQPTLAPLAEQVFQVLEQSNHEGEIVFVDDGSRDGSWEEIVSLSRRTSRVNGIRFRRNFGKAAALAAGFSAAKGDIVITMDADLQDDPKEIPRFLEKLESGFDVVSGWKRLRHDPWHKRWPSWVFNRLVSGATGVHLNDHNCGFKAYRREVVSEVNLYGELHRFVPVLAAARGWRVAEIAVHHHPRKFGRSKYGVSRIVKGLLDLATVFFLTGYGRRPLHLMGTVGLLAFCGGLLGLTLLTFLWITSRILPGAEVVHLHERAVFYYAITAILLGSQLLVAGLLAEMITALQSRTSVPYSIAETVKSR